MAWIKRNLFFLIGSLIALGLMGFGIFYLLGQIGEESKVIEDIQAQYAELTRLGGQKPHPGNDKVDNIKTAREQTETLNDYIKKERATFRPIASIPDISSNKISNKDFARELRNTVADLRRAADQQSVKLPPDYYFGFEAQRKSLIFETGTLEPLATHLGEVKALCDVLFTAKINFLDSIQREIISTNQDSVTADYLSQEKTVSTPLADLTPYRLSFRCFSAELALVLSGFATSPNGMVVQNLDIEPVNALGTDNSPFGPGPGSPPPQFVPPPGFRGPRTGFPPPGTPLPAPNAAHSTNFLYDKPFRVTLLVEVIKPRTETNAVVAKPVRTRPTPP
jgi:hypothetical protein